MTTLTLPPPRPHYRRVVDHLDCPECGQVLSPRRPPHDMRIWTDTTEYGTEFPKVQRVTRRFYPCECLVVRE